MVGAISEGGDRRCAVRLWCREGVRCNADVEGSFLMCVHLCVAKGICFGLD
jgi:hypothetical protein